MCVQLVSNFLAPKIVACINKAFKTILAITQLYVALLMSHGSLLSGQASLHWPASPTRALDNNLHAKFFFLPMILQIVFSPNPYCNVAELTHLNVL